MSISVRERGRRLEIRRALLVAEETTKKGTITGAIGIKYNQYAAFKRDLHLGHEAVERAAAWLTSEGYTDESRLSASAQREENNASSSHMSETPGRYGEETESAQGSVEDFLVAKSASILEALLNRLRDPGIPGLDKVRDLAGTVKSLYDSLNNLRGGLDAEK